MIGARYAQVQMRAARNRTHQLERNYSKDMEPSTQAANVCTPAPHSEHSSAVRTIQLLSIAWMGVELAVALAAGIRARSISLTAFGIDSGVELLSAFVVLRRFRLGPGAEKTAARINAVLLYALGGYILGTSAISLFSKHLKPDSSVVGIFLLIAAAIVMPLLGAAKNVSQSQRKAGH